ncbi:MAG: BamA/TamA family outer membrane protein [Cyclobacteriaceae bacterium]|nr:BamA/TamA family outer membrane protein [Cyclobacteriaceae bacterium]
MIKKGNLVPLPLVFYSPETSLAFGGVLFNLFQTVPKDTLSKFSNVRTAIIFTLRSQLLVDVDHDIFTRNEKYRITGKFLYAKFPDYFYGIGNQTLEEHEEQFNANNFNFRSQVMRQFFDNFYAGLIFNLNYLGNVEAEKGGMLDDDVITGQEGGISSGIGLIAQWDTRDFNLNCTRGHFFEIATRHFRSYLGSDFDYNIIEMEAMKFFSFFPRQVVGLQFIGRFSNREVPFHQLSLLGGDKMMRGYYRGRYRDKVLYAFQAEYRWQFYKRFGVVFFGGLGDVSEEFHTFDFSEVKPSCGIGLRYMILPKRKVNLRLDIGFGKETNGIYINITEAF